MLDNKPGIFYEVFTIQEDGNILGLWTDQWDVRSLGECSVERASNIEFCNESKKWQVVLSDGTFLGEWDSRQEAIDNEVSYLQGII